MEAEIRNSRQLTPDLAVCHAILWVFSRNHWRSGFTIMAGHSQFKNILYRKEAMDTKRSRMFSKLAREITIASKTGYSNVELNAKLRSAIQNARNKNMPKDIIERSVKRASAARGESLYEDIRYEGYGPGNVAVIVETLTDNRHRTASAIRAAFNKNGGTLCETNSVTFYFERIATFHYPASAASADTLLEIAIDVGACDVLSAELICWDVLSQGNMA